VNENVHELELLLPLLKLMHDQYCYYLYPLYVHAIVLYQVSTVYIYDYDDDKIFQNDHLIHQLSQPFHLDFEDE
jgi:hypothetical protein